MAGFQSYIICTSPRSGSTLLCKLLEATGIAGVPDSHFYLPSMEAWLLDHDLQIDGYTSERDKLSAVFDAARSYGTGKTGIFGLRVQRHSFEYFMQKLDHLHPDLETDFDRLSAAFGATFFIHLTRENKLHQAISLLKAEQTGLWHRAADGSELERSAPPQDPVYDAEAIAGHIADMTQDDADWNAWFQRENLTPLRLTYDGLSRDPKGVLSVVLQRLGLNHSVVANVAMPTAKLTDATSRAWAERFLAETAA